MSSKLTKVKSSYDAITLQDGPRTFHQPLLRSSHSLLLSSDMTKSRTEPLEINEDHILKRNSTKHTTKMKQSRNACKALLQFPSLFPDNAHPIAAKLLLLVLLSQVATLLAIDGLSPLPIIILPADANAILPALHTLLVAIQGFGKWKGSGWHLDRQWVLSVKYSHLGDTYPSINIMDYIGGKFKDFRGDKWRFCFPYCSSTVLLLPRLPEMIQADIIQYSPLALFIQFKGQQSRKQTVRDCFDWHDEPLDCVDDQKLKDFAKRAEGIYSLVSMFLDWFYPSKKRIKSWQASSDRFRPKIRQNSYLKPDHSIQTDMLCLSLSLLECFLTYATRKAQWLTEEEAEQILQNYWKLSLPESYEMNHCKTPYVSGMAIEHNFSDPDLFYTFLVEHYLTTYQDQIITGNRGYAGTMALRRQSEGTNDWVVPRLIFLQKYEEWLLQEGGTPFAHTSPNWDATVQRRLLEAGIPLRGESNNPSTWRYQFYDKSTGKGKDPCLALIHDKLPEHIQKRLNSLIGQHSGPLSSPSGGECPPIIAKGADSL